MVLLPFRRFGLGLKQENFLKENSFIDQLKLRLGYGSVGNQSVEAYRIYSKMSPVRNSDGSTSYKVDRPAAPYLNGNVTTRSMSVLTLVFSMVAFA